MQGEQGRASGWAKAARADAPPGRPNRTGLGGPAQRGLGKDSTGLSELRPAASLDPGKNTLLGIIVQACFIRAPLATWREGEGGRGWEGREE